MEIKQYDNSLKIEWNGFVSASKNGTFLFNRDFMDYHSHRFLDHSLLFYKKKKLIALLPGNIANNNFYSHQGLTYGGFILSAETTTLDVLALFDLLIDHLKSLHLKLLYYKPTPYIYHTLPSDDDLYLLFRKKAQLVTRNISATINLSQPLNYSRTRKTKIKKGKQFDLKIEEYESLSEFWEMMEANLKMRYGASPTHSLEDMQLLKTHFPTQIRLFCIHLNDKLLAGCLVFETKNVIHTQYTHTNKDDRNIGALDVLLDYLITDVYKDKMYFDFGTSNGENGYYLHEGLISQKEGFGARGVIYDTYMLDLTEPNNL